MKKLYIILACLGLSACFFAVPEEDYTSDYYTQTTTYVSPSTSHVYISEKNTYVQPDVVYIKDTPPHHHSKHPHYYYPEHHDKHPAKHPDYKPHKKVPSFSKNEKPVKLKEDKREHLVPEKHHKDEAKPDDKKFKHFSKKQKKLETKVKHNSKPSHEEIKHHNDTQNGKKHYKEICQQLTGNISA